MKHLTLILALLLAACGGGNYGPDDADTQPVSCSDHPQECK